MTAAETAVAARPPHASVGEIHVEFDPEHARFEGRRLAYDAEWSPIRGGVGYDTLYEAPTLAGFWASTVAGLSGPVPPAPDFAAIEAISDRGLSEGFIWGARYADGTWTAECMDEVRGKWLNAFEAPTLEAALAAAMAWNDRNRAWIEEVRQGWTAPEWLTRARTEASVRLADRA